MKPVQIIRTRYVCNFSRVLQQMDVNTEALLRHAYLPAPLLDDPDNVMSVYSLGRFLDVAVRQTGRHDLALLAGDLPLQEYGLSGRKILEAPDLFHAIQVLTVTGKSETSVSDFFLSHADGHAWFCCGPIGGSPLQSQQIELYRIRVMLVLLQTVLGKDWLPEKLRLRYTDESSVRENALLGSLNVEYGSRTTGIVLPLELLATPMPSASGNASVQGEPCLPVDALTMDSLTALKRLMISYLPFRPSADRMAVVTGISKRTLQRFLQEQNLSYSGLLDQVIFNQAVLLLNNKSVSVTEAAYRLGYSDVAHFSRSFRRLTGLSPTGYRQRMIHNRKQQTRTAAD
jgi:AraC-like DNA-binding protein